MRPFYLILVLLGAFFLVSQYIWSYKDYPLNWDEVDYINASRKGFVENNLEVNSFSLHRFLELGYAKKQNDTAAVQRLAKMHAPESEDVFYLRHFHPPLPHYYWQWFDRPDLPEVEEWRFRLSNIIWLLVIYVSLLVAFALIDQLDVKSTFLSALAFGFVLVTPAGYRCFALMSHHIFHLSACVVFCGALMRFLRKPSALNSYILGVSIAFLFLTLEMCLAVIAGAFIVVLVAQKWQLFWKLKRVLQITLGFVIPIAALWMGFFLSGGSVKALLMYMYRILAQNNTEYAQVSWLQNWLTMVLENPLLFIWILLGAGITIWQVYQKQIRPYTLVPLIVGSFYAIVMTPFMLAPSYMLPALGMLSLNAALAFYKWSAEKNVQLSADLFLVLSFCAWAFWQWETMSLENLRLENEKVQKELQSDLSKIRPLLNTPKPVISTAAHIFNFYLKTNKIELLDRYNAKRPDFFIREYFSYRDIKPELMQKKYGLVIVHKWLKYHEYDLNKLEKWGYTRKDLNSVIIFY
ncbi:MAG: hypothetical protein EAZ57_08855 [Cytophagales bacterium]|nr:MAG: hypothetical protein EAZ67_09665 [Cytophagales bacterium]TAF60010.1 MAG: hypothetical protein EAZ57_08855 [Cytophagales bacterium]